MHLSPLIALLLWVPIGIFFFYRFPVRLAILATLLGGWAVLPSADFVPSPEPFPYWIMGVALPAGYFITKAAATGLAALLGSLIFDFRTLRSFRPRLIDLPMAIWIVAPLLAGLANPGLFYRGVEGAIYHALAWGVPYLMGRLYFASDDSLLLVAKAFVIAGVAYIPICVIEFFIGPQLYAHLYGYEPYRFVGATRYIGFRPIGFLEDGNQLGIWMAIATLMAIFFRVRGVTRPILGIPLTWAAAALLFVTLACQSGGSIVLLVCLLPFALMGRRFFQRGLAIALIAGIVFFAGLRLTNAVSLRSVVNHNAAAHAFASFMIKIGRPSFGWRLEQDERHVRAALAHPILGSGLWNWWQGGRDRPWGLWLLSFGMYGIVGLAALESLQLLPVLRAIWFPPPGSSSAGADLRRALAAVVLLAAIDGLLNSSFLLPVLIVTGGLTATLPVTFGNTVRGT